MSTSKPGESGWNDPPKMEFTAAAGKPRRTLLNKRVAYTMSGASDTSPAPEAGLIPDNTGPPPIHGNFQILPPASTTETPRPVPLMVPTLDPNHPEDFSGDSNRPSNSEASPPARGELEPEVFANGELALKGLMEKFECKTSADLLAFVIRGLENTFRLCGDAMPDRAQEEVSRKLDLFKECWLKDQLPDIVKIRMTHLASALHEGHYDIANEIHLTLIVDHTADVHQWMVAIKRIVQEAIKMGDEKREI